MVCLHNIKLSTRKSDDFRSSRSVEYIVDNILYRIKDMKFTGNNEVLRNKLMELKQIKDQLINNLKLELGKEETTIKYEETLDYIKNLTKIFDPKKTGQQKKADYLIDNFGISIQDDDANFLSDEELNSMTYKKIYYNIIAKMMDYYIALTKQIYTRLEKGAAKLKTLIEDNKQNIKNSLLNGGCHYQEAETLTNCTID